jgi:hypothetical protein
MSAGQESDSVFDEPHLQPDAGQVDRSEDKARRTLDREAASPQPDGLADQSVYDEPDILPGRTSEVIEQNWSCGQCGYNLRGLPTGHRCPECGHVELYRPPPVGADSYRARFERQAAATTVATGWWVAAGAALAGGVFAIFGAMLQSVPAGMAVGMLVVTVVFGPAVEETMKLAFAALVVELRPWWFNRLEQIRLATVGSAAVFAAVENLIYLNVYIPQASTTLRVWRWTVCVGLHIGCTYIASQGLVAVWRRAVADRRRPRMSECTGALIAAIIVHGLYNGAALAWEVFDVSIW